MKQDTRKKRRHDERGRGIRSTLNMTTIAVAATAVAGESAVPLHAQSVGTHESPVASPGTAIDGAGQPGAGRTVHRFDIPAGPVDSVVDALSRELGITFSFETADIGTVQSKGVSGVLTAVEALERALSGTGITARFVAPNRVVLELRIAEDVTVMAPESSLPSPKYTAPLRDLPRALTVIPATMIQSTGSATLVEALRSVPGITLGAGEGGNPVGDRPFIRGYDSQASTFVDGIRDIGAQSREVFNLESVEVAKGPSGAYGGRGTAGGSLNLNTKTAQADNFFNASFSPGTANYYRGTVDANVKLTDSVAFRFNALGHDADVAGRDAVHSQRWGVAPTLTAGLGKATRATVGYYQLHSDDLPDSGIPYNNPTFNPRTDGSARVLQTGDGSPIDVDRDTFYGLANRDFRNERVKTATLRVEHDFSRRLTLRNVTRYGQSKQDYIWTQPDDSQGNLYYGMLWRRINSRITDVDTAANQTDLYGNVSTGRIGHTFAVGAEFSRERGENDSYTVATGSNRCVTGVGAASSYNCTDLNNPDYNDPWAGSITRNNNPTNSQTETRSVYAFDTLNLSRLFQANVGVRLDDYTAVFTSTRAAATGIRTEFERKDTLVNYQLGVVFKPTAAGSLYASHSTSSIPTGNALAQGSDTSALSSTVNANLEPEKNRSLEGGVKWETFGGRALLTGAVFHTETTNSRITLQDGTVAMAGEKRVNGVELGLAGRVTNEWQLFTGYTWLDAILVHNGGSGAAFGLQDGARFPNTPEHSLSLWSTYAIRPELTAGGGIFYVSKVWGSQPSNKWVPSYWRTDLMASYRLSRQLELQLNVQNLTDEVYFDRAYPTHYASIAPGRSARITLNTSF